MRRPKYLNADQEAGLRLGKLKPGRARDPRRLVPWWARMMRRVRDAGTIRRQPKLSAGNRAMRTGSSNACSPTRSPLAHRKVFRSNFPDTSRDSG